MTLLHSYRICGLSVASEIGLPGLIGIPPAPPQVTIRYGDVPQALAGAQELRATWQMDGDRFLLLIPGIARFLLHAGRAIEVAREADASEADVAIFLTGTVFGILLHQREQFVLHASAVRVGDRAVLFCGASGMGKSTMAAALGRQGYAMVTDDISAIAFDGQSPAVLPDGRRLKLWADAVDHLDLASRRGDAVRGKLQKFYVEPERVDSAPLPVAAAYMLRETRPPDSDGIADTNIVDATLFVRQNAYRPRLLRAMKQNAHYLRHSAGLIAQAGVYVLRRPMDFKAMPDTIARLEAHWRTLGLLAGVP